MSVRHITFLVPIYPITYITGVEWFHNECTLVFKDAQHFLSVTDDGLLRKALKFHRHCADDILSMAASIHTIPPNKISFQIPEKVTVVNFDVTASGIWKLQWWRPTQDPPS